MANNPRIMDNVTPFTRENAAAMGAKGGAAKKGSKHLSTHIQEMLEDEEFTAWLVDAKQGLIEYKGAPVKAIVRTAAVKAVAGDKDAREWLAKYGYGTKLDLTTNGKDLPTPILSGVNPDNIVEAEIVDDVEKPTGSILGAENHGNI